MRLSRSLHLPSVLLLLSLIAAGCSDQAVNANNTPPTATIEQPSVGTEVLEGSEVTFSGTAQDQTTSEVDLGVTWSSSLDGELLVGAPDAEGVTTFATSSLSPGTHTITLAVRDGDGASGQATVDLVVTPDAAPTISIVEPTASGVYYADLPVTLQANANDAENLPADLRVSWAIEDGDTLESDLTPDSSGLSTSATDLATGTYVLIATATDMGGNTGTDTVTISVGPPNTSPTCAITGPANQSSFPIGDLVTFEGTVGDVDVPADWLTVSFESNVDGPLGDATPSTAGDVGLQTSSLTAAAHTITMSVTDEVGGTCSDFIFVTISTPPTVQIDAPVANTTVNDNETVAFAGVVADAEDAETNLTVEWTSSLDGALGSSTPDSSGIVGLPVTGLTAGTHVITLTATDSVGLTGTDTVTLDVNASPTAPVVSITPAAPLTTDDLSLVIDTPSADPDNGPNTISYTYEWSLNGNPAPAYSGLLTIPSSDTANLQTWSLAVVATDGLATSAAGTAAVSINNSVPSITSATVAPTVGLDSTLFTVTPAGWADADGDPAGYQYQWYAGGSAVTGATGASFTPTGEVAGTALYCEVTPFDGQSVGLPVNSNTAAINTPSGVSGVAITPPAGTEATTFTASYAATNDVDGQSVTVSWQWSVDGAPVNGATGTTLNGTSFDKGQTVTVTATPNDGLEDGTPVISTGILVDNTAPSITSVSISPTSGGESTTFTCTPAGWSDIDPADTTPAYTWQWTVAGANSVTTQSITGTSFDAGQAIACTATPTDGTTPGTPVTSAPVTVGNTAPSITSVAITPTTAYTDTLLTATLSGWFDADGDSPAYMYEWFSGTTPIGTDSPTLAGITEFDKNDSITVQVTPMDASSSGTPVVSSPVVILNTPPTAPGVTVTPSGATDADDLICTVTTPSSDDDPGDTPTYTYAWLQNGSPTGLTGSTLASTNTTAGETWTCEVTPNDLQANGSVGSDSEGPLGTGICEVDYTLSLDGVAVFSVTETAPALSVTPNRYLRLSANGVPAGSGSMFDSLTASDLTGTTVRYSSLFSSGGGWYRSCGCSGCGSTNISGGTVNVNSDWNHFSEYTTPIRWDDGLAVEVDIYWGSNGILGPALTAGLPPSSCHACCPWNCIGDFMSGKLNPDGTATIDTGVAGYTATLAAGSAPSIGTWHTLSFEVSPSGCSF